VRFALRRCCVSRLRNARKNQNNRMEWTIPVVARNRCFYVFYFVGFRFVRIASFYLITFVPRATSSSCSIFYLFWSLKIMCIFWFSCVCRFSCLCYLLDVLFRFVNRRGYDDDKWWYSFASNSVLFNFSICFVFKVWYDDISVAVAQAIVNPFLKHVDHEMEEDLGFF